MLQTGLTDFLEQAGRRESRHKRQYSNLRLAHRHTFGWIECLRPVIAAFHVDIRSDCGEKPVRAFLAEDDHRIHAAQRRDNGSALAFWHQRSLRTFELSAGSVRVEADNEEVANLPGALQVADVAKMEKVEAAIGGDDALPSAMGGGSPSSSL